MRFTRVSVEQGLSQSTVRAIYQDHVGFVWLGTDEGLNRFDGYSFTTFKHDPRDPGSLPDDVVTALHEDRRRRLWVGTGRGLCRFDRPTESFACIPAIHHSATSIEEDTDGKLWVGTVGEGLFEGNPDTGEFVAHLWDPQDPGGLVSHEVSALLRDRSGRLWIGTKLGGLDRLDDAPGPSRPGAVPPGRRRFVHHRHDPADPASLAHDAVWGLAEDPTGKVWVATYGGGLSVLDLGATDFRHYRHRPGDPKSLPTDLLTRVFVDRAGTLWVGTDGAGLQRYDPGTDRFVPVLHNPAEPDSLSQNVVRSIYEDGQGHLWVGTYLGGANVLKKPRQAFGYFTHSATDDSSLGDAAVASFLEDAAGRIWVGTERGWLHRFKRQAGAFVRYRLPSGPHGGSAMLSLHQDRRGRLWAGTYLGGLVRFDPLRAAFTSYRRRPGDPRSLASDVIWDIAEDGEGGLWLATDAGVDRFDPELGAVTAHHSEGAGGLSQADARALLFDRDGNLWVGTFGGLNLLRRGSEAFVHYRHDQGDPRSLGHDGVVALHQDRQGHLWAGTFGAGLSRLDGDGGFTVFKEFPSNVIYAIQEDASGRLWVSTNHGLARLDPATGGVESFDLNNGLQSLQFHLGAGLRTRGGRLLFGSVDGFYDFDPEEVEPDAYAPPVVLTSLRVFGEPWKLPAALPTLQEVELLHRAKAFSLEFAALDYNFPRRNRYAYVMEGFSDQWIQLGSRREVTFTNLDPGTYVFRVKASNGDGVWNPASGAALKIMVWPPFWRTWWFRGLATAVFALGLLGAHRARVRRLTADIAERKRSELALRQAEEKYRSIFEQAVEGMFQSAPNGRFLTANPALARMLGYGAPGELLEEVTDIERQLYVHPEDRREMVRKLEQDGVVHGFECELRRRDGNTVWVSASVRVVRDAAGRVLCYEGTNEDISDRRRAQQAEAALRAAREKAAAEWELTFDSIEALIVILDARGRVVRGNRAVRETPTEGRYEDCLGRPVTELAPGEPWAAAEGLAREVAATGRGAQAQVEDKVKAKTWDVTATPIRGAAGGERLSILVARDATRLVELQDSLRRSETMSAMGSLLAGVAHEVRNPLFGISATLDAVEAKFGGRPPYSEAFGVLRGEVRRLEELMTELFDFGRPVQGEPVPDSLAAVLAEAATACEALAKRARVELRNDLPLDLPLVRMDRRRLALAFENLLQNAIQHSPAGGTVWAEAVPESQDGSAWVRCCVKDSGPGFQEEDRSAVFRPFFTRRRGGTGLGLSIVQRIVEGHGGSVAVGNRPEGGGEVTVRLPCC